MNEPPGSTDGLTPEAAFSLVGEPTRLAILRAVWEHPDETVSFSAIRDRVGTEDTGRFNYHLQKLQGHFVEKRDGGERPDGSRGSADGQSAGGYALRQAGTEVVRAVLAGVLNDAPERDPEPFGAACPDCGGDLVVAYDGHATVSCGDCGTVWMTNEFPPAGLTGRDAVGLARALDRWTRHRTLLAFDGVCPSCASDTVATVDETSAGVFVERVCDHCRTRARAPVWAVLLRHPEVAGFLADRGVDPLDGAFWELRGRLTVETDRHDEGVDLVFTLDGDRLHLALDGDLRVATVDRRER